MKTRHMTYRSLKYTQGCGLGTKVSDSYAFGVDTARRLPLPWGSGPHVIFGSLGLSHLPSEILLRSAFWSLRTWSTDRPTNPRHYSVCSNRLNLIAIAAMWPKMGYVTLTMRITW